MPPGQPTAQKSIRATCIECEETTRFEMGPGSNDGKWTSYECSADDCDHHIKLELDPDPPIDP